MIIALWAYIMVSGWCGGTEILVLNTPHDASSSSWPMFRDIAVTKGFFEFVRMRYFDGRTRIYYLMHHLTVYLFIQLFTGKYLIFISLKLYTQIKLKSYIFLIDLRGHIKWYSMFIWYKRITTPTLMYIYYKIHIWYMAFLHRIIFYTGWRVQCNWFNWRETRARQTRGLTHWAIGDVYVRCCWWWWLNASIYILFCC